MESRFQVSRCCCDGVVDETRFDIFGLAVGGGNQGITRTIESFDFSTLEIGESIERRLPDFNQPLTYTPNSISSSDAGLYYVRCLITRQSNGLSFDWSLLDFNTDAVLDQVRTTSTDKGFRRLSMLRSPNGRVFFPVTSWADDTSDPDGFPTPPAPNGFPYSAGAYAIGTNGNQLNYNFSSGFDDDVFLINAGGIFEPPLGIENGSVGMIATDLNSRGFIASTSAPPIAHPDLISSTSHTASITVDAEPTMNPSTSSIQSISFGVTPFASTSFGVTALDNSQLVSNSVFNGVGPSVFNNVVGLAVIRAGQTNNERITVGNIEVGTSWATGDVFEIRQTFTNDLSQINGATSLVEYFHNGNLIHQVNLTNVANYVFGSATNVVVSFERFSDEFVGISNISLSTN